MLTSSIWLLGSYLQPSPNPGHCLFSCFWSCGCPDSRVLAWSPQESGDKCWAAASPWGRWFYGCGGILTSGHKSSARQNSGAWFLPSWPKGFLPPTKEDQYGPAVNRWENKSFGGIWEREDGKNKEGICLLCHFIDLLNFLIPILRLQLIRLDACLVGLGIIKKLLQRIFVYGVYIHIYMYTLIYTRCRVHP